MTIERSLLYATPESQHSYGSPKSWEHVDNGIKSGRPGAQYNDGTNTWTLQDNDTYQATTGGNNLYADVDGGRIDAEQNVLNADGDILSEDGYRMSFEGNEVVYRDSNDRLLNEEGHFIDENTGKLEDINGISVDSKGEYVAADYEISNSDLYAQESDYRSDDLVSDHTSSPDTYDIGAEDGVVWTRNPETGNYTGDHDSNVATDPITVNPSGQRIDPETGNLINTSGDAITEDGYLIKEDADGNRYLTDTNGERVNEDGRFVDQNDNFLDSRGNFVDADGYQRNTDGRIEITNSEGEHVAYVNEQGHYIDLENNLISIDGHPVDSNGQYISDDGFVLTEDRSSFYRDENGDKIRSEDYEGEDKGNDLEHGEFHQNDIAGFAAASAGLLGAIGAAARQAELREETTAKINQAIGKDGSVDRSKIDPTINDYAKQSNRGWQAPAGLAIAAATIFAFPPILGALGVAALGSVAIAGISLATTTILGGVAGLITGVAGGKIAGEVAGFAAKDDMNRYVDQIREERANAGGKSAA